MPKKVQSQWEFGELFPAEATRKVLSVSELTAQVRRVLEGQIGQVWVTGEITNLRVQSSGHIYFTLKDATAQVACVLFRGEPRIDREQLQDGRHVAVCGQITVYEPRGQYQLRITAVELRGVGALQAAFEKLKQRLQAEGLFAQERKRPLPRYPQRIGVVTSPTGAAVRDLIHVVRRRNPGLEMVLAPCRVQGAGAAEEIAASVLALNGYHSSAIAGGKPGLDLILVTRGGGSLEDLWAFNEEAVARAIFHSALPVVSAVGHEIDFTISDFVADARAATPSAAAEILTEGVFSSSQFVLEAGARLKMLCAAQLQERADSLLRTVQRLNRLHPRRRLEDRIQHLDDLHERLLRCARQSVRNASSIHGTLMLRLSSVRPALLLGRRQEALSQINRRLQDQARTRLMISQTRLRNASDRLRLLGPEQVLARGYSITTDATSGAILRSAEDVAPGQRVTTRLSSGKFTSRVE